MSLAPITIVDCPPPGPSPYYLSNRAPLKDVPLTKLPVTAFKPGGWLKKSLELQRDGLTGHLMEISKWLTKEDNAWLSPTGKGKYGWEELPYWLRGYSRVGYVLNDSKMLAETKVWVEGTIKSARPDGDFGPIVDHRGGFRDLWAQMLMLQVLQGWYEFTGDKRVIDLMTNYFKFQLTVPDDKFLKDYWENSRGGDNLASVYWLYNITGDKFLLELGTKIDKNTANWRRLGSLPNYHNVNIAECFREPGTYYLQSHNPADLEATYRNFDFIREKFGQVPGGMFGSDENCRPGHDDPHQATETCGFVEQILSNAVLMSITGDPKWAANSEDVAFNSLPAALMPDYRSLRYLTAPNMVVSDAKNHAPGIANAGPFLVMNPFGSRCCQHNHTSSWTSYLEGSWMATSDKGLAAVLLHEGEVTAKVGSGQEVVIKTKTKYPFEEDVVMTVETKSALRFPLYILIPSWAKGATAAVADLNVEAAPGKYLCLDREWKSGDSVKLHLPMKPEVHVWDQMRDSVSVNYGPLTLSLKIKEKYNVLDGTQASQGDSGWIDGVDKSNWPTYEILPDSKWNYGLVAAPTFEVVRTAWPADDYPFSLETCPLEVVTTGKQIPDWGIDQDWLLAILPKSPVKVTTPDEPITLVPMGAARLRISAFPVVK
ncbi:MAG: glycoside hydrolase family 127 protein [Armatimonadetes bacterium]|nr:glycoside hydrolase family 127 protein [Armatimonadota bacterium]